MKASIKMRCTNKTCEGRRCKNPTFSFGNCVVHTSCAICLDRVQTGTTIKKLVCGHAFHEDCINQHLDNSFRCPMCREVAKDLKVKTYFHIDMNIERNVDRVRELLLQMYEEGTLPGNLAIRVLPYGDDDIMILPA